MRKSIAIASLAAALAVASAAFAQAPAGAPAGSTALCNDGSYTSAASRRRACAAHKGVKEWYGRASTAGGSATAPKRASAPAASGPSAKPTAAAAGGGPGKVWVNKATKTYHCSTDKWYGKTKSGEYLSEADAKSQGFHPAQGKACQ